MIPTLSCRITALPYFADGPVSEVRYSQLPDARFESGFRNRANPITFIHQAARILGISANLR